MTCHKVCAHGNDAITEMIDSLANPNTGAARLVTLSA
jgi:hypothetical protein